MCTTHLLQESSRERERGGGEGERERGGEEEGGVVYLHVGAKKKPFRCVGELYLDLLSFDPSIYGYNFVVIYMYDVACTCTCKL